VGLLEDVVADADGTIARFREVVGEMQGYAFSILPSAHFFSYSISWRSC
jgi:hypothetical protein